MNSSNWRGAPSAAQTKQFQAYSSTPRRSQYLSWNCSVRVVCLQLLKCRHRRPWYNNKQAALSSSGRGATFEPWWGNTLVGSTPSAAGSVACIVRHTARQYCPQVVRGAQFEPACPNTASVFDSLYCRYIFLLMSSQQRFQHHSHSVWAVAWALSNAAPGPGVSLPPSPPGRGDHTDQAAARCERMQTTASLGSSYIEAR